MLLHGRALSTTGPRTAHQHRQITSSSTSSRAALHGGVAHLRRSRNRQVAVYVAATASSASDLRQLMAQKERELAAMFESGRPMPQASVVAALRAEIAALDDQLNGRPVQQAYMPSAPSGGSRGGAGGRSGNRGPGGPRPGSRSSTNNGGVPAPLNGPPAGAVRSRTEQLADKAFDMVEQQLRANQGMGQEDDNEVARLEQENTQLRAEAYNLLARQQQLEAMLAEVKGQKPPELLLESAEGLLARMRAKLQKTG